MTFIIKNNQTNTYYDNIITPKTVIEVIDNCIAEDLNEGNFERIYTVQVKENPDFSINMSADKGLLRTLQLAKLENWLKEAETKVPFYDYTDEEKDALKSQIIKRLSVDSSYNKKADCKSEKPFCCPWKWGNFHYNLSVTHDYDAISDYIFFKYNEAVSCISKISLAKEKYKALKTY